MRLIRDFCSWEVLAASFVTAIGLFLNGCSNYTAAPVCDKTNQIELQGITGQYEISIQDAESFEISTLVIDISGERTGKLIVKDQAGSVDEQSVCQVNGRIVVEDYDDKAKGYSQSFLSLTGDGMTTYPVMFDRRRLSEHGVDSEIFELPESIPALLRRPVVAVVNFLDQHLPMSDKKLGLRIQNQNTSANRLFQNAKPSPIGITLFRR